MRRSSDLDITDTDWSHLWCFNRGMRITVRLDPQVAAAAERLRMERDIGLGEAVNELALAGLAREEKPRSFRQRTATVGLRIDVSDVAGTLETLDQHDAEDGH